MIRLDHRDPIPEGLRGAVLALGNFDGFHLGHKAVVRGRSTGRASRVVAPSSPLSIRTRCATSPRMSRRSA
jgi:riboflavin kinase/FMN adenylyltransferase